jgi:sucrose-6-phosphate hydrolase SacC (GH32 family)
MQSIPRDLKLKRFAEGIRLVQEPVAELRTPRSNLTNLAGQSIGDANRLLQSKAVRGDALEIEAEIDPAGSSEVGLKLRQGAQEETLVGVNTEAGTNEAKLFIDRTHSGNVSFDEEFPGRHAGPLRLAQGRHVKLHIFVDRSSVEVFGNDGETVISDSIFPADSSQGIEFYSRGGEARIVKAEIWNLRSAWK